MTRTPVGLGCRVVAKTPRTSRPEPAPASRLARSRAYLTRYTPIVIAGADHARESHPRLQRRPRYVRDLEVARVVGLRRDRLYRQRRSTRRLCGSGGKGYA